MGKNWWEDGIPEEGESSFSSDGGYAWWQRELPPRVYIKSGDKKLITFVDDRCFRVWEHAYWVDGKPGFATCTKKIAGKCPLCKAGNKAYEVGFFTVIDNTGYTDREGEEHKDYLSLLPAKHYTLDLLRNKYSKHDGLIGKQFEVFRSTNQKAPTVGDDWNFEADVELPEDADPLDYKEILTPFDLGDMRGIADTGEWRGKKTSTKSAKSEEFASEGEVDYGDDGGAVPF